MRDNNTNIPKTRLRPRQITAIGLMTAAVCIIAPFSIPVPVSPVPLSLANFVIFIAVYVLGMKQAAVCVVIYLALGTAGLPVFSSFSGGPGRLAGPTGGYLAGFLFIALIQGFFLRRFSGNRYAEAAGMVLGMAVCYIFGTAWLARQIDQTFLSALTVGVLPYLPGDALKIAAAAAAGPKLRRAVDPVLQDR